MLGVQGANGCVRFVWEDFVAVFGGGCHPQCLDDVAGELEVLGGGDLNEKVHHWGAGKKNA